MHLRAVGENPDAAASVGIRVQRTRYFALVLSGILAALGGISHEYGLPDVLPGPNDVGTRLYRAGDALSGRRPPGRNRLASVVFGAFDALSNRVGTLTIPSMLPQMLPYMATVLALVIYALQNQLTVRVRTLRSAEGEGFDATFWKAIQRLSVLQYVHGNAGRVRRDRLCEYVLRPGRIQERQRRLG